MMQEKFRLGILGGGQLSMMLLQKAQALGLDPSFLTLSPADPACRVSNQFKQGDPKKAADLKAFTKDLDLITFESEFFDAADLKKELQSFKGQVFPNLEALDLLQDRKSQKNSFKNNNLKTSPFLCTSDHNEIKSFFKTQGSLVAKTRRNGYDGYGTTLLRTSAVLENFLQKNKVDEFIFEKLIQFDYEVALQVARSRAGDVVFFPFVKTIQNDNKCFLVEGPEKETATFLSLKKSIKKYLKNINYVGVVGFEFFKVKNSLILNEVAPRVHNTGHHTLDSCNVDQFTMHWLCALQDQLPEVELKSQSFVMLNLIGQSDSDVIRPDRHTGSLFWYGKSNRKGRKLGHINFVGSKKKALINKALIELKKWKF